MHPMNIWSRRRFLRTSLLAGAATVAPLAGPLRGSLAAGTEGSDWSANFARRLASDPMLLGWQNPGADFLAGTARVEGRLPEALVGHALPQRACRA